MAGGGANLADAVPTQTQNTPAAAGERRHLFWKTLSATDENVLNFVDPNNSNLEYLRSKNLEQVPLYTPKHSAVVKVKLNKQRRDCPRINTADWAPFLDKNDLAEGTNIHCWAYSPQGTNSLSLVIEKF